MSFRTVLLAVVALPSLAAAADAPPPAASDWVDISAPVVKTLEDEGRRFGFAGKTAGVAVDRATGDVYIVANGLGIWKSTDRGATFARADTGQVGGRCETGSALQFDPAGGGRLACFMLDGKCAMTLDGGKTWLPFKDVGRNWDFAAVDWSRPQPATIFAARHESGGEMYLSIDAGKSWKQIAKDAKFAAVGLFDDGAMVTTKGDGILRSTDGGATWTSVSDFQPAGRVVAIFNGVAYWMGKDALLVSKDKGVTWARQGGPVDAPWGPMFGKDEKHLVAFGKKGFYETTDAGQTWTLVAPPPPPPAKGFAEARPGWFVNVAWDPNANVFYASRMGQATWKLERKK